VPTTHSIRKSVFNPHPFYYSQAATASPGTSHRGFRRNAGQFGRRVLVVSGCAARPPRPWGSAAQEKHCAIDPFHLEPSKLFKMQRSTVVRLKGSILLLSGGTLTQKSPKWFAGLVYGHRGLAFCPAPAYDTSWDAGLFGNGSQIKYCQFRHVQYPQSRA
jgi:hypothetical protein